MAFSGTIFKSIKRGHGVVARVNVKEIDKGLQRIQNGLRSIQLDKSYVKAGLLSSSKASKPRPRPPPLRIEDESNARLIEASNNPFLLAVLAARAAKHNARRAAPQPTSVELGLIHEFGQGHMPARPFIRPAFNKHRSMYLELLRRLVQISVYQGKMPFDRALGIIGSKMAADMKKYVTAGPEIPPPNSPAWFKVKVDRGYHKRAKRKKPGPEGPQLPPRTLVDTGRMVNSITHVVVHRSTGDQKRKVPTR